MHMNAKILEKFVVELPGYYSLKEKQQENAAKLIEVSRKFLQKAKISFDSRDILSSNTIILESGHQPNFLPHAGTWKKAFLLHQIHTTLTRNGHDSIAFFGFADQNIATARVLSKNQVPALNKEGSIKIGFKINDADKFKSFCSVPKPIPETWEKEITRVQHHYSAVAKKTKSEEVFPPNQWEQVHELLWNSYERADTFAELNSIIFARLCNELLGIHLCFFRYSAMSHDRLFLDESQEILRNLSRFNQTYNTVIGQKGLDIPPVTSDHLPFWYNCECGTKINLLLEGPFTSKVTCPLCSKEQELDFGNDFCHLSRCYDHMDFNAVSRNCALAQGLGDTLFIAGFGGSLQYGQIADQVSRDLGFHLPLSLAWRSGDYYLGMAHRAAVHDLSRQFSLVLSDFLTPAFHEKISRVFHELADSLSKAESGNNQKDIKYLRGVLGNAKNSAEFAKNMFSLTPSFLDILANQDSGDILHAWNEALERAELQSRPGIFLIQEDVIYPPHLLSDIPPDNIPVFYKNIRNIEVT
jgi:hypothetical protein